MPRELTKQGHCSSKTVFTWSSGAWGRQGEKMSKRQVTR